MTVKALRTQTARNVGNTILVLVIIGGIVGMVLTTGSVQDFYIAAVALASVAATDLFTDLPRLVRYVLYAVLWLALITSGIVALGSLA